MKHTSNAGRILLAALIAGAMLAIAPLGAAKARPEPDVPSTVCDIDWRIGKGHMKDLIRCVARRWKVPGGPNKALDVARCESGFNPGSYSNGNAGVFQHRVIYWPGRAKKYGFGGWSVYNGRANVIVSVRMAHVGGWEPWNCA
jgi:hypothetical protein